VNADAIDAMEACEFADPTMQPDQVKPIQDQGGSQSVPSRKTLRRTERARSDN
jgi:hypothetical protein